MEVDAVQHAATLSRFDRRVRLPFDERTTVMAGVGRDTDTLGVLLERVAAQDQAAFAELYDVTRTRVFGMVLRVLRDPGYSEETTQEVYLQVWKSAGTYDPRQGSALSWLITLAHRRAVDRVRSEQSGADRESKYGAVAVDAAFDSVSEEVAQRDDSRRVVDCLGTLTELQRRSVELAYYRGLTYREVAEQLSSTLPTVKSRIRDGLLRLKNCLGVTGDDA
jgi:RNA polymerase sigma-70 factor, ECF subfamily